jgi:hypothetical protein
MRGQMQSRYALSARRRVAADLMSCTEVVQECRIAKLLRRRGRAGARGREKRSCRLHHGQYNCFIERLTEISRPPMMLRSSDLRASSASRASLNSMKPKPRGSLRRQKQCYQD